ncbi:MAG: hypothetical protein WCK29_00820 [archaeon]
MKNLVQRVLSTGLLAGSLFLNGCETPPGATQPVGAQMMDDLANIVLFGGVGSNAAARKEAQRGNFDKANSLRAIGEMQKADYDRQTAMDAARAGKTEVNVDVNNVQPNYIVKQDPRGIVLTRWVDSNGNGKVEHNLDIYNFDYRDTFRKGDNIIVNFNIAMYGNRNYNLELKMDNGLTVLNNKSYFDASNLPKGGVFQRISKINLNTMLINYADGTSKAPTGVHDFYFRLYINGNDQPVETKRISFDFD